MHAAPHEVDYGGATNSQHVAFAKPCGTRCANKVVGVLPGTDNPRVTNSPRHLPRQAARRHDRGNIAARCDQHHRTSSGGAPHELLASWHVDVVVTGAHVRPPVQPRLARRRRQQVLDLISIRHRKPLCVLPHQHDVIGVLHDQSHNLARRLDPLERTDRSGTLGRTVHARCIELHHTLGVRQPAIAHGLIAGIELLDLHPFYPGVERIGALHHHPERFLDATPAVGARHGTGP